MQPAFIKSLLATMAIVLCVSAILIEAGKKQGNGKKKGRAAGGQRSRDDSEIVGEHPPVGCRRIPSNFTMCYGVGYENMRVPTILQHYNVEDAMLRSRDFMSMLHLKCHPDLRKFLCSLFASICIPDFPETEIKPCQSLCLSVKSTCESNMTKYGYQWPYLLNCTNFPDGGTCLGLDNNTLSNASDVVEEECTPCSESYELENLFYKACNADLVFRTKKLSYGFEFTRGLYVNASLNPKSVLKSRLTTNRSKIVMKILESESGCSCSRLSASNDTQQDYLVMMEQNPAGVNVISFIMKIVNENQQELVKFFTGILRKNFQCPLSQQKVRTWRDKFHANLDASTKENGARKAVTKAPPKANKKGGKDNKRTETTNGARKNVRTTRNGRNQKKQRVTRDRLRRTE